jgi:hypothetical protein
MRSLKVARAPLPALLLNAKEPWMLEELQTPLRADDFAAIVGSPLLPHLRRLDTTMVEASWMTRPRSWGALRELKTYNGSWDLVAAAAATSLESLVIGNGFRFLRGKDGRFSRLRLELGERAYVGHLYDLCNALKPNVLEAIEIDPASEPGGTKLLSGLLAGKAG